MQLLTVSPVAVAAQCLRRIAPGRIMYFTHPFEEVATRARVGPLRFRWNLYKKCAISLSYHLGRLDKPRKPLGKCVMI